jgi:sodium/potassium-transporting ATPase subunit alpha
MFNNQQYEEEERQQQQRARDPYDEEVPPRQSTSLPRISVEIAATFRHRSTILSAKEEVIRMSGEKGHVALRVNDVAQSDSTHSGSTTPTDYDFHTVPLEELATRFTTNTEKGLDSGVAENRLQSDGPNLVIVRNYKWILDILGYYFGGICILLWPAVVLSILCYQPFGEPDPDPTNLGLAVVILIVIIIQGSFSLYQDYSSSKVMKSINAMLPQQAVVIRDGKQVSVPVYSLVRGDIVKIETGHRVPADLRLISVQNLKVDTSMLTGESDPLVCTLKPTDDNYMNSRNLLFMGSGIVEGVGYGMVVAIGNKTVMGRVAKLAAGTEKGTSTLRKEVHRMVIIVAIIGILTGLILITYWAAYLRVAYPGFMSSSQHYV